MSKISDYQNVEPFLSNEFDDTIEKSAAFENFIKNFNKNVDNKKALIAKDFGPRIQTKFVEHQVDKSIHEYDELNEKAKKKFEKYPAATTQSEFEVGKSTQGFNKLLKSLDITFTPFGVMIASKQGLKKFVIQTIETQDMNEEMFDAWKIKNATYFKNYMAAKMKYSKLMAEHRLALEGLRSSIDFQKSFSKNASELLDEYDEDFELLNLAFFGEMYKNASDDVLEKLAVSSCITSQDTAISVGPQSDIDSFFALCNETGTIPDTISLNFLKVASRTISPKLVREKAKIVILEDRVVYLLDNSVLTEVLAEDMSVSDLKAFKANDKSYFKKKFERQALIFNQRLAYHGIDGMEKVASKSIFTLSNVFEFDFIPAVIYKRILDKKLGKNWVNLDGFVIMKTIETKCRVEVISNSALNKVLSIAALLSKESDLAFTSKHAFEKIIRSFNDLPIDFEMREMSNIDASKLSYGIASIVEICGDEVLEKINPDVFDYIADILVQDNMYAYYPNQENCSERMLDFISILNSLALKAIIRRDIDGILDTELESETEKNDEIIQAGIVATLDFIRSGEASSNVDAENHIIEFCKNIGISERFVEIIKSQIEKNISIDVFLQTKNKHTQAFIALFGIGG